MTRPLILVADDNAIMAKLVCRYLELNGFEAQSVQDGVACLEFMTQRTPDVVITDIMMPRLDGLSMTKQIRSSNDTHDIPVIVITALSDHDTMHRAFQSGATDVVFKPLDETSVVTKVRLLTNAQRLARHNAALHAVIDAFQQGDVDQANHLLAQLEGDA